MKNIEKILVYLKSGTGESQALRRSWRLAAQTGASIKLVDVIDELPMSLRAPSFGYPGLLETLKKETLEALEKRAAALRQDGVVVSVDALYGKAFLEITREVLRGGHDLVVLDADREGGPHLWGTTAMRLFRNCPAPIWAVQADAADPYRKVLAAVDPLSPHDEENALNRSILEAARAAARLERAELHAVFAWGEQEEPSELLARFGVDVEADSRQAMRSLTAPFGDDLPPERVHVVPGQPVEAIEKLVEELGVDLLVMGTLVRTGIAGVLIGNTAEKLLGAVQCSILALKPSSFQTPVELE